MITPALIILAIAAVGGLILAASVLRKKLAPWALSFVHASLGAIGLILLVITILKGNANNAIFYSFILLVVAALGGFALAAFHLRRKIPPKIIVIIHAGLAVTGFLTLLSGALT